MEKYKWLYTDSYEQFLLNPNKKIWENVNIEYIIEPYNNIRNNTFNFRKDKVNNSGIEIACFGCSNTFGLGLPNEWTWPYKVNELFGFDKYNVINYGIPGCSIEKITLLIYEFLVNQNKNYESIFIFFPDTYRYLYGLYENNKLNFCDFFLSKENDHNYTDDVLMIKDAYLEITNSVFCFYSFIKCFKFIEEICKMKNIPFYWYSWSKNITNLSEETNKEYFNKNINKFTKEEIEKLENLSERDFARDHAHIGRHYCSFLAKCFYNSINR